MKPRRGTNQYRVKRGFKYKVRSFFRKVLIALIIVAIGALIFKVGTTQSKMVYTKQEVIQIREVVVKPSILEKIAKCESGDRHYGANGQVLVRGNVSAKHNSVDIGRYQLNSLYWGAKATELGYNLWVESDNEKMAEYIFNNYGSSPWSASSHCWSK